MKDEPVERMEAVVIGNKAYFGLAEDGVTRITAQPGDTVFVTAVQLSAFPQRLCLPEVVEVVKAAEKAVKKAKKQVAQAAAARKSGVAPKKAAKKKAAKKKVASKKAASKKGTAAVANTK